MERRFGHNRTNGRGSTPTEYEYVAITDHSKGLKIAGEIDEKDSGNKLPKS